MTGTLYGSARPERHHTEAASTRNGADEEQPLLNGTVGLALNSKSLASRIRKASKVEVKRDWADVVLIFCYTITGLLDSSSISIWGSFVSMQTGKTRPSGHQTITSP